MEYQKMLLGENPYNVCFVHSSYPAHCHNEIELLYCTKGNVRIIAEDEEYILPEGGVLIIGSLIMHQIIIEDESVVFVLEFGSQFLGAKYYDFAMNKFEKCCFLPDDECYYKSRLFKPIKRLYEEYMCQETGFDWAIQGLLYEIFTVIVRFVPSKKQEHKKRREFDRYIKIQKVFDLVTNEYHSEITVNKAAECAGYDTRAFCRLFKAVTNMTFHDYLNSHRINVSMGLLEHKNYSIGEIARLSGIPVAKSFNRLFRKYTGMSPSEYRAKTIEKVDLGNI